MLESNQARSAQSVDTPLSATDLTPEVSAAIEDMLDYHPWTPEQATHGRHIVVAFGSALRAIIEHVPPGPDRTVAIRKIREARMDCNSAITHAGKY